MNSQTPTPWKKVLTVAAIGFLLRLWLIFGSGASHRPELFEYDDIARNLLAGQGYTCPHLGTLYRNFYGGVFYIWMTAFLYVLFPPGQIAVLVAQSFFSSLLGIVTFLIGHHLWNRRAGLLAAFLTVSHPALVYYDTHKLHPLSFDAFMTSLAVLMLLRVCQSRRTVASWLSGVVLGAAMLQRGSLLLLFPLGLLWLWVFGIKDGQRLRRLIGCLVGVAVVMTPWIVRGYHYHGSFVLLTTSGEHLWVGNAPHSIGSNLLPSGRSVLETSPETLLTSLRSKDELGQCRLFWNTSLTYIRNNPRAFLSKIAWKFCHFWTLAPTTGLLYPKAYLDIYLIYYAIIVFFAMLGAVRLARSREVSHAHALAGLLLVGVVFLSVSAIHSLFYIELRHRWGIESLLLILSAVGLTEILKTPSEILK